MDLQKLKSKALQNKKQNKKLLQKVKKKKGREIDEIFNEAHEKVFSCTDCLKCANCCTTTGPLYTDKDIDRVSKHLRLKPTAFIDQYLRVDEEGDYVLQTVPCTFLGSDNYCSIYDVRPKACAEYPHTDRNKQSQLLNLNLKNTEVCPAVFEIFEEIKKKI
jgi:Fe-S-cluster containining protein